MVEEVKSRYHMGAAQDLKQPMRFSLKFPFIVWPENRSMNAITVCLRNQDDILNFVNSIAICKKF